MITTRSRTRVLSMIIEVNRSELSDLRTVPTPATPLGADQARLRIDAFALTANNVTYAVFGDAMQYWNFFPSDDVGQWGRVPVWGFATVVESTANGLVEGERLYGYFPMADELVIDAGRPDDRGVTDLAAHRAPMASAYNRYVRCAADPIFRAGREAQQMLLYPLFFTSFLIDDFLADASDFGAEQVIVSSASSKTAIGVGFLTHQRGRRVVGLTSARNRAFVEGLGIYDEVVDYDALGKITRAPSVYVDIAGNPDVRHAVHADAPGDLRYSMVVGGTHWAHQAEITDGVLAPPAPQFFFAPDQIKKRTDEWGAAELERRVAGAWDEFSPWTDSWMEIEAVRGAPAVATAFAALVGGSPDPRSGLACSMTDESAAD